MNEKILYDWHSQDSRIKGPMETANSVVAQYGTGGGNTPLVVHTTYCIQGSMIGHDDKNGSQGSGMNEDVSFTLNTVDRHAVAYNADLIHCNNIDTYEEQSFSRFQRCTNMTTLKAVGGAVSYGGEALIVTQEPHYIVRRLMPLECSRLQGFPDGWGGSKLCLLTCPMKSLIFGAMFI
nr:MAG TPA: DNA methyltransferase [Caudoviricetes sp.]